MAKKKNKKQAFGKGREGKKKEQKERMRGRGEKQIEAKEEVRWERSKFQQRNDASKNECNTNPK